MRKELVTHLDPKSPVSETFRTLRTNIQFMNSNRRLRSLLVTSTMPGEGKSWVASNLAVKSSGPSSGKSATVWMDSCGPIIISVLALSSSQKRP